MVAAGPTPGRLPAGYTELAYIETDGNSYIDTGYTLASNTDEVEMDCYVGTVTTSSLIRIFGARSNTSSRVYAVDSNNGNWRLGYNGGSTAYSAITTGRHVVKTVLSDKMYLYVDGSSVGSKNIASATTAYNCAVFAVRASSLYYSDAGVRCYEFKLKRSGSLLRHLIPAMRDSDSVVGMYDLVSDTFLTNAGTGTFNYGTL